MVRLSGTLCVATVPALRESLASGSGRQGLLVDLSGVRALDAAGLRALLSGYVDAADRGCPFVFVRPTPGLRRVLDVVGVEIDRVV